MYAVFADDETYLCQFALMETGFMRPLTSMIMDHKEEIIFISIDCHCLIKKKAAMEQCAEELEGMGVLHYIKHHYSYSCINHQLLWQVYIIIQFRV